jgi:hypothetical protein
MTKLKQLGLSMGAVMLGLLAMEIGERLSVSVRGLRQSFELVTSSRLCCLSGL